MRHASVVLIALIVLCSLAGCGKRTPELASPPVILNLPDCPAPDTPRLPLIDGALPLDSPVNIKALLERDDIMRFYISGLNAAISCFRRTGGRHD